jgi:predicted small lipoprotein YifL
MRWVLVFAVVLQVATCGQRGPLTLPENGARMAVAEAVSGSAATTAAH